MKTRLVTRRLIPLTAALAIVLTATSAVSAANRRVEGCAREFEIAERTDMESFREFEAETFRPIRHADAVTIFASGDAFFGIEEIIEVLEGFHFGPREAIWMWTEFYRVVDGCKSAFILYETTYELPSIGFRSHALTGVTYTHQGRRWLAIADQGMPLP